MARNCIRAPLSDASRSHWEDLASHFWTLDASQGPGDSSYLAALQVWSLEIFRVLVLKAGGMLTLMQIRKGTRCVLGQRYIRGRCRSDL